MQNKKKILMLVLIILLAALGVYLFYQKKTQVNYWGSLENTSVEKDVKWISSNFENSLYAVNIWYPEGYIFNGGGDTEAGTYHDIRLPNDKVVVTVVEGISFCKITENYIGEGCVTPEVYYQDSMNNKDGITKIENYKATHLGMSVFAFKMSNSETYIFKYRNQKPEYYMVTFDSGDSLFSRKEEFMNKLELIK